ncbi:putative transposase IS66 (plasmid) [Sinorhizobium meliloti SM11]|uniref:Transposase IS66 n=1 Tax=Sinorhizobium meliloti (strain SM11) TaxID=707241 RepID=F7XC55_SINMM|nr:putative transposase IS66 [Sinorhizobium meliloti SM11]
MNNVDPLAWLTQTLERIANGWPSSEIDAHSCRVGVDGSQRHRNVPG